MNRDDFDWCLEKEPTYTGRPRPIIPLSIHGAVRSYIERRTVPISRCSTCHKPSAANRCAWCQDNDARLCPCGSMTVASDPACDECGAAREAA